jgi:hypothetical protein
LHRAAGLAGTPLAALDLGDVVCNALQDGAQVLRAAARLAIGLHVSVGPVLLSHLDPRRTAAFGLHIGAGSRLFSERTPAGCGLMLIQTGAISLKGHDGKREKAVGSTVAASSKG